MEKHLERSKAGYNEPLVVVQTKSATQILNCTNNITKKLILGFNLCLLGSCDGLVLLYNPRNLCTIALNPSTGKFGKCKKDLIYLEHEAFVVTWFGRHPSTQEYVMVTSKMLMGEFTLRVFSLSGHDNYSLLAFSSIELLPGRIGTHSHSIGTLYRGRVHCHNAENGTILAYDLESNEILRMRCPVESHPVEVGIVDGCFSAIHAGAEVYEVWMMKEYGVEESWTKYANVEGSNYVNTSIPLAICPNGDVVFNESFLKVKKYSLRDGETKLLKTYGTCMTGTTTIACIQSLVSPDIVFKYKETVLQFVRF